MAGTTTPRRRFIMDDFDGSLPSPAVPRPEFRSQRGFGRSAIVPSKSTPSAIPPSTPAAPPAAGASSKASAPSSAVSALERSLSPSVVASCAEAFESACRDATARGLPEDAVRAYCALASEKRAAVERELGAEPAFQQRRWLADYERLWKSEADTWKLVLALEQRGNSPSDAAAMSDGGVDLEQALFQESIVLSWLKETSRRPGPFDGAADPFESTRQLLLDRKPEPNMVQRIDFDATLREQKNLASQDERLEADFLRHLFALLRCGDTAAAIALCERSNTPARGASFLGTIPWRDPRVLSSPPTGTLDDDMGTSPMGNYNRALWKHACRTLAQQEQCSVYERAIYAFFCGELAFLLPVCHTWEDQLWAMYHCLVERLADELPVVHVGVDPEPFVHTSASEVPTPSLIFDSLLRSSDGAVAASARETFHYIQMHLVLGRVDDLLRDVVGLVTREGAPIHQQLLRFATHLCLFYQQTGRLPPDSAAVDGIYELYVDSLIQAGAYTLVAQYTSALPAAPRVDALGRTLPSRQVERYATFLRIIADPLACKDFLRKTTISSAHVARLVAELAVESVERSAPVVAESAKIALDAAPTEQEALDVAAIHWLEIAGLADDHVAFGNRLLFALLMRGRTSAALLALGSSCPREAAALPRKDATTLGERALLALVATSYADFARWSGEQLQAVPGGRHSSATAAQVIRTVETLCIGWPHDTDVGAQLAAVYIPRLVEILLVVAHSARELVSTQRITSMVAAQRTFGVLRGSAKFAAIVAMLRDLAVDDLARGERRARM